MIAAIYARKSTEQLVADDQKSVTRQVAHARVYAERHSWTVDEAHVYVDDGISGAEFANRPGFVRLMASLKPRPSFQVLIMSEESRLGREAIETAYALKQLVTAGVRVFFYLENRERTLDSPTDKMLLSLTAFADELERERARQRVTDAMVRKARAGHVTGGRVFGYDNVEILAPSGERSHVERRINKPEAAVVRRIFELAANGMGQKRIAIALNADGAPTPRAQRGRPSAWGQSSIHEVLTRDLYRGEIVYNRTRKRNRWGLKRSSLPNRPGDEWVRPEREWLRVPAPQLRIVPEDLWMRTQARLDESRARYHREQNRFRGGRIHNDSKYLLPGLARCAVCNGGLFVKTARRGPVGHEQCVFSYACTSHHQKGRSVCANGLRMPMSTADTAVLAALGEILTEDLVDEVIARMRELLEASGGDDQRIQLLNELDAAETQVARLTDAIATTDQPIAVLVARLQHADSRRQALAQALTELGAAPLRPRIDWRLLERQARERLRDWRALLQRQLSHARALLREILVAPIRFTPFAIGARRGYRFEGEASIGGLLRGLIDLPALATSHGVPGRI